MPTLEKGDGVPLEPRGEGAHHQVGGHLRIHHQRDALPVPSAAACVALCTAQQELSCGKGFLVSPAAVSLCAQPAPQHVAPVSSCCSAAGFLSAAAARVDGLEAEVQLLCWQGCPAAQPLGCCTAMQGLPGRASGPLAAPCCEL